MGFRPSDRVAQASSSGEFRWRLAAGYENQARRLVFSQARTTCATLSLALGMGSAIRKDQSPRFDNCGIIKDVVLKTRHRGERKLDSSPTTGRLQVSPGFVRWFAIQVKTVT